MREKTQTYRYWDDAKECMVEEERGTGKWIFEEEDKIAIVAEYLETGCPASQIIEKYHLSSKQTLFNWMDKYGREINVVSLSDEPNDEDMAKKDKDQRIKELEAELDRTRKALELEKLRSHAFDTMIDIAEKTFNIPVRKKSGTKQ